MPARELLTQQDSSEKLCLGIGLACLRQQGAARTSFDTVRAKELQRLKLQKIEGCPVRLGKDHMR